MPRIYSLKKTFITWKVLFSLFLNCIFHLFNNDFKYFHVFLLLDTLYVTLSEFIGLFQQPICKKTVENKRDCKNLS